MTIHYSLFENHLTADPADHSARVRLTDSIGMEDLARHMARQGSKWNEQDIQAVGGEIFRAIENFILDGYRVNLGGLCDLYPRISGTFHGASDHFDQARHRVDVGASPGARLREAVRDSARVAKVETVKPAPTLVEYRDTGSGETDATLTPGNIGTLDGHRLKFDPAKTDEGIFLLFLGKTEGGEAARELKVSAMQKNKPSQLVFLIPANLPKGDYRLEVRARVDGGSELRDGHLDATLTV